MDCTPADLTGADSVPLQDDATSPAGAGGEVPGGVWELTEAHFSIDAPVTIAGTAQGAIEVEPDGPFAGWTRVALQLDLTAPVTTEVELEGAGAYTATGGVLNLDQSCDDDSFIDGAEYTVTDLAPGYEMRLWSQLEYDFGFGPTMIDIEGLFLRTGPILPQGVCLVTTTGTDTANGRNWTDDAMDLHTALGDPDCSEIWVAGGVYKPHASDQNVSFVINRQELEVYGGFDGTETMLAERDPSVNPTVLSGDIDDNDTVNTYGITEAFDDISGANSYHVVWVAGLSTLDILPDTVLDGFVITAGWANAGTGYPDWGGGGLLCDGDVHNSSHECSPTLNNITFIGNYAALVGGAMYIIGTSGMISNPVLNNVTFSGNYAGEAGGAMFNSGCCGGMSSPVLNNVSFIDNGAGLTGGAMYNSGPQGNSSPLLNNVAFSGNYAGESGGAIYNRGLEGISSPVLNNVILWDNDATNDGPEVFNELATPEINDSIVQGGCPAGSTCTNIIDADPQLGPLADNGGFTPTLLPAAGSAAIDAGNNATCLSEDQRGVSRPLGSQCDIGAVERVQVDLAVVVSGQGEVDAAATPVPADGGIEDCDQAGTGQSHCAAQYVEGASENVILSLMPAANWHLADVGGCGGDLLGSSYIIDWLNNNCTVTVTFNQDPVDGQCGAADGGVFTEAPTKDLCAVGEPTEVLGDGPWTWNCQGIAGGADASCGADFQPPVDEIFDDRFENN